MNLDSPLYASWPDACCWRPILPSTLPVLLLEETELAWEQLLDVTDSTLHGVLHDLKPALMCSPWALDLLRLRPALFTCILQSPRLNETVNYADSLQELSLSATEAEFMQGVRQLRQREMLRISLRDLMAWSSVEQTLQELSALAQQCIIHALAYAKQAMQHSFGLPFNPQGEEQELIVLGMGKLGGGELNFSSDIDLIFIYPESGVTNGRKPLDNQSYFIRLGQLLIKLLDELTADGFVFRVDMRLRPFGDSGALAVNFAALENYYQTQGREWERYAMIKARAVTGGQASCEAFKALLKPFVFRRYLDFSAIQSLRELKRMIADQVKRKSMQGNVKLGRGGIREVEFIGQAFQLIYGGKNAALQQRSIVHVLQQLGSDGLLEPIVVESLLEAYTFLRLTENRLQMVADAQTHDLPESRLEQTRLAFAMGFADWDGFINKLGQYRDIVAQQFADVFAAEQRTESEGQWQSLWRIVGEQDIDKEQFERWLNVLIEQGLDDAEDVWRRLRTLKQSSLYQKSTTEARQRVDSFIPVLLCGVLCLQDNKVAAFIRALEFVRAVVRRSVYLVLLQENPRTLSRLLMFFSQSGWMAENLTQQPALLDQLIDTRLLYSLPERPELDAVLLDQLDSVAADDFEGRLDVMRRFKRSYTISIAAMDVTQQLPLMRVSDHLTQCAEVLVQQAYRIAWLELAQRHGSPYCQHNGAAHSPSMAVIAYGKLGGIELGYSSDLDVVFLHDSQGEREYTSGRLDSKGVIDNTLFFARLAQKFSLVMNAQTRSGQLYEIDTRLRPDGNSGEWVKSMRGFAAYQRDKAWTWEHQALVRARFVCGSALLQKQFEAVREEILCRPRDREDLRKEVVKMREKMRENLGATGGCFSLKQDAGGLTDIEFIVQYAVLGWANQYPELTKWTDNIRILELIANLDVFPAQDSLTLIESYRAIRAKIHRLALDKRKSIVQDPGELAPVVEAVAKIWRRFMLLEHN